MIKVNVVSLVHKDFKEQEVIKVLKEIKVKMVEWVLKVQEVFKVKLAHKVGLVKEVL